MQQEIKKRAFNQINWFKPRDSFNAKFDPIKLVAIFEKFGRWIEKFSTYIIDKNDVSKLLRLMPNLVELDLGDCTSSSTQYLKSIEENSSPIKLEKLKKLTIDSAFSAVLVNFSSPELNEFQAGPCSRGLFNFISRHSKLKTLK